MRFSHPLLASTVYVNAPASERRALHVRLATLTSDPEERARHLALAAEGPDPEVAAALDQAARRARVRGAPDAAADLADLACRMTGPDDVAELRRRRLDAAEYRFDAGDATRAIGSLRETIAATAPGPERAKILYRLASMSWMNLINGVRAPCEQARAEAGDDPELQTGIHQDLAWVAFYLGDLDEALAEARAAVDWVATETATVTRADALATLAFIEFIRGDAGPAALSEAVALQEVAMSTGSWTEGSVYTPPGLMLGLELMWMGRLDEARDVLEGELAQYELRGMYIVRQEVLCYLAELECRAGRWERAVRIADESMDIVQETGQAATQSQVVLFNQAWPRALLGRIDEARELATTGVRLAEANDDRFNAAWNHAVLGFIDLSLADLEGARRNLEPAVAWLDRLHAAEPGDHPVRAGSRRGARRPRADRRGGAAPRPSRGAGPGARPGLGDGDRPPLPSAHRRRRRRSRRRPTLSRGIGRTPGGRAAAVRDRAVGAGPRPDPSAGEAEASREGVARARARRVRGARCASLGGTGARRSSPGSAGGPPRRSS